MDVQYSRNKTIEALPLYDVIMVKLAVHLNEKERMIYLQKPG